ncbi:malto-oligosyltrehalose trehalohydrolase [Geomonas sp. Red32]|uniref:malto-oligosyltrehalose trehalohydrolase n=1 Tax=Geomonas sp. Red32 TaxID=2912856 RepID=UPI00202CE535|nr:malto-oligosyltrehalose trehalohydrolase [Geomonas sp. Red32]MCM0083250.1 malto-oligosyltrehalose trehalohydrolase [Geomonas sp. Red32]
MPKAQGTARRYPVGAEIVPEGVSFRVWAPNCRKVEAVILGEQENHPEMAAVDLKPEKGGYFSGVTGQARSGSLYRYRLDGGESFPCPASRYQPEGPHGPSMVIDPSGFEWTDAKWKGIPLDGHVIYEIHTGTFTREGTWAAAMEQFPALLDLGVTLVEIMPVADFPGRFGWGYDGVNHFAPCRNYGAPEDLKRFVDRAHQVGLGVVLDVVYNHFGPEGNYLEKFSHDYYSPEESGWGRAINFDENNCGPVREYFVANGAYWMNEYHFDGLRFDSTHSILDRSPRHILGDITDAARAAADKRKVLMFAENEPQDRRCLLPAGQGGFGMDAVWNDDFHHAAHVALTGYHDAYYMEYLGSPQELVSSIKWGYLYQGQRFYWQGKRRGSPTAGKGRNRFVHYIQNHDQIGNSAWGARIHTLTNPGALRAVATLLLLSPQTPLIFQGQEFSASNPFQYFADLSPEISEQVHIGRIEFLKQFTNIDNPHIIEAIDKPYDQSTFEQSRLDLSERARNVKVFALYRDLIRLRKSDTVFSEGYNAFIEGAVLGRAAFLLRYQLKDEYRLLLFNLGRELHLAPAPEPMLAPPEGCRWEVLWTSERIEYGGSGTPAELDTDRFWIVQGNAAVVLKQVPEGEAK